jgi:hypothetical protein
MTQPTPYQYAKLGSHLEFLRGVCTVSLMQTTSLAAFPNLMENLPLQRYSVLHIVEAIKSLLVLLQEMKLEQSRRAAAGFQPMLKEMQTFLAGRKTPEGAYLHDPFAEQLVLLSKQVASAVRRELSAASPTAPQAAGQDPGA